MKPQCLLRFIACLVALLALAGCASAWEVSITGGPADIVLDREALRALEGFAVEVEGGEAVPLEQVFYEHGFQVIDEIVVESEDGQKRAYDWGAVMDDAYWQNDGSLLIAGKTVRPAAIHVEQNPAVTEIEASITDIAPTAAAALGLPPPSSATGQPLVETSASHVLLLYLDGFGYVRYTEALEADLIPNLAQLDPPLRGITTYPSITSVSSASVLTGAPPSVHGADRRGIRKTETETILDVAAAAGLEVAAVEGESLPFALRSAEITLSGDRDGNGSTDDNVLANTLAVLEEGMPHLLYVHFHGIDDAGHRYGPRTPEDEAAIRFVDDAVGQILAATPPDTLVIIFADHGMHAVNEDGRLGNHGHLVERDMYIPIFIIEPR